MSDSNHACTHRCNLWNCEVAQDNYKRQRDILKDKMFNVEKPTQDSKNGGEES